MKKHFLFGCLIIFLAFENGQLSGQNEAELQSKFDSVLHAKLIFLNDSAEMEIADGQLDEAEKLILKGFQLAENAKISPPEALFFNRSKVFLLRGNYAQAIKFAEKSVGLATKEHPPGADILIFRRNNLAQLLGERGDYFKADSMVRQNLREIVANSNENSMVYVITLLTFGEMLNNLSDLAGAEKYVHEAFVVTEKISEKTDSFRRAVAMYLAYIYFRQENNEAGCAVLDDILPPDENDFHSLGDLQVLRSACTKDPSEKIDLLKKGVANLQKFSGTPWGGASLYALDALIEALIQTQKFEEAADYLNKMTGLESEIGENTPGFMEFLEKKSIVASLTNQPDSALFFWNRILKIHAQNFFEQTFFLNEKSRADNFANRNNQLGILLSFAQNDQNLRETAINFQLFHKSILCTASQRIRQNIQADTALAPVFSEWQDTRERLAWCYTQPKADFESQKISIPALEFRADSLEKIIAHSSADFASANLKTPFSWRAVQKNLKPGEAALEIARFNEFKIEKTDTVRYAIFIITPEMLENPAVVFLPDGERLEQILTEKYLSECASPDGKGMTEELFKTIWQPLEPFLKNVNRVFVSSDGAFHKINLGALRRPDGSFLGEKIEIRPVFSLRDISKPADFAAKNPNFQNQKTAVLVGNPDFSLKNESENSVATRTRSVLETDSTAVLPPVSVADPMPFLMRDLSETRGLKLENLPGSQKEVDEISILLQKNGWKTSVFTRETATETIVKSAEKLQILHLATHGYFLANEKSGTAGLSRSVVERNPMLRSMLFFAGAQNTLDKKSADSKTDDGVLTAFEAQNLDLENTELVVLSACQTAQGKLQNGEGVYGLQRALKIAGAKNIIISLWDVDDEVGREFMLFFYKNWLGGSEISAAFRGAQLSIKAKYPQPFFWAGFVLIGG